MRRRVGILFGSGIMLNLMCMVMAVKQENLFLAASTGFASGVLTVFCVQWILEAKK